MEFHVEDDPDPLDIGYLETQIRREASAAMGLGDDVVVEPTGRHVKLAGVTVADFREGKIRSYRTYFDDISLLEQVLGA